MIQRKRKRFSFRREQLWNCMLPHFIMHHAAWQRELSSVIVLPKGTNEDLPFEPAKRREKTVFSQQ